MAASKRKTRVLLIDDIRLCRTCFAGALRQVSGFRVAEAVCDEDVLETAAGFNPHVILLNISMHRSSGISLLKALRRHLPKTGLLAFSCFHRDSLPARRAVDAGADGFISADAGYDELVEAVRAAAGGVCRTPGGCGKPDKISAPPDSPLEGLSPREFEVFCLTGHGYMTKRIADQLKVSVKTIETYRQRIRQKLGLADGGELLCHALNYVQDQRLACTDNL